MRKFLKTISWLIIFIYIGFIFSNSLMNGISSGNLSLKIVKIIMNIIPHIKQDILHLYIRKLAHFTEFFILGLLLASTIKNYPLIKNKIINFNIFLIVPVIDETIQNFVVGRVSSVIDILIDTSGLIIAAIFLSLIFKKVAKQ